MTLAETEPLHPQVALRPPETVMRLERMGSFFPTRLSFLRSLLRDLAAEKTRLKKIRFDLDENGFGSAIYELDLHDAPYSLIAYTSPLDEEDRTDRVIAEAWDACFVLYDGRPSQADVARLRDHATRQEAGRYDSSVLVLSRANKSVRLFDHVVAALAQGEQPAKEMIVKTGYLMRTTAVYGNGKFGMADRSAFAGRNSLYQPFRLEMLTVYLIREFTFDLANHVASKRGGAKAAKLDDDLCRCLGIGNSTGLGMAPFLVGHPVLINNWMQVRETAVARVRAVEEIDDSKRSEFRRLCQQATIHLAEWNVDDDVEQARIERLRADWEAFLDFVEPLLVATNPYDRLLDEAMCYSVDLQEFVVALILEPNGDLIDGLCACMESSIEPTLDPTLSTGEMASLLADNYRWALNMDVTSPEAAAMAWYVSEEKLEPRFGTVDGVPDEIQRMPHDIVQQVKALARDLNSLEDQEPMASFLARYPQHRHIVRRVQTIGRHPYGEVQDNLVAENVRPIDLLRCKLSFFGAAKFDPRSDRWTRITLYQGAPVANELTLENAADCFLPSFGARVA